MLNNNLTDIKFRFLFADYMFNVTSVEVRNMAFDVSKLDSIFSKLIEKGVISKEDKEKEKEEEEITINFESEKADSKYIDNTSVISGEISTLYEQLQEAESQSQKDAIKSAIDQKKEEYENAELEKLILAYIEDSDLPKGQSKELNDLYTSLINADGVNQRNIIQEKIEQLSEELGLTEEETDKLESFNAET